MDCLLLSYVAVLILLCTLQFQIGKILIVDFVSLQWPEDSAACDSFKKVLVRF